jgi:hypothetical protein
MDIQYFLLFRNLLFSKEVLNVFFALMAPIEKVVLKVVFAFHGFWTYVHMTCITVIVHMVPKIGIYNQSNMIIV